MRCVLVGYDVRVLVLVVGLLHSNVIALVILNFRWLKGRTGSLLPLNILFALLFILIHIIFNGI